MKYVVTGGAGFIGSHLTDELINQGHKVVVLDNLSTGKRENVNPKAEFVKADITKLAEMRPHFSGADGVFHVAALPRVQVSIEDPDKTHDVNVNGTLNVLIAARDAKIKRIVYSASSSAYGNVEAMPLREDMKPKPMSPYGLQKYIGEEYGRLFSLLYGLETVSLRYFNVYGPRMAEAGAYLTVMRVFLNQKNASTPMTIVGDGEQTRDFTHVYDVVRANLLAMNGDKVGKGEVINIGGGKNYSVNQIATLVGGPKIHVDPRIEPRHTLADNSLAKKLLGWEPKMNLEKEIATLL
ncbi:MAG: NAD-dependent epimerase/dehydratase family protein [Candidatus Harrisonbacteria bacterium]|nr:NAD-dependent epimerase/dehydratase family protein [Candidatus Harrisonbacteria bacterium]